MYHLSAHIQHADSAETMARRLPVLQEESQSTRSKIARRSVLVASHLLFILQRTVFTSSFVTFTMTTHVTYRCPNACNVRLLYISSIFMTIAEPLHDGEFLGI